MSLSSEIPRQPDGTFRDQFLTTSIGSLLVLKSCGFIQEQHARVLDIGEHFLKLQVGSPWWQRWLGLANSSPELEVLLQFEPVTNPPPYAPKIPQACVKVQIRPRSLLVSREAFEAATRQLIWKLRYHYMACA